MRQRPFASSARFARVLLPMLVLLACLEPMSGLGQPARVKSYELDVSFRPDSASLRGRATVDLDRSGSPDDEIIFYLHGELDVLAVHCGEGEGTSLPFEQQKVYYRSDYSLVATHVIVDAPGEDLTRLLIEYAGPFNPSRARSPSDYMRIAGDGVYLRSYGYSLWFPVFLEARADEYDVSFSRVTIRTPLDLVPVFVGERVKERIEGDERVSTWVAKDVPIFSAQMTARPFTLQEDDGYFIYSLPDSASREKAGAILVFTRRITSLALARYRAAAAPGQVHVMQMPRYGDISSYNVVGISGSVWSEFDPATALVDPRGWQSGWATRTLAHELIHLFVQVPTPLADPLWALAVEGFPAYFHLPLLAEIAGEEWYEGYMVDVQQGYLDKRDSGTDRRGRRLPAEKPLLELTPGDLSRYKDRFVLADRALLFFDHLRRRMGKAAFVGFTRDLFNRPSLDAASFREVVLEHLPGAEADLRIWLESAEYPERLRIAE